MVGPIHYTLPAPSADRGTLVHLDLQDGLEDKKRHAQVCEKAHDRTLGNWIISVGRHGAENDLCSSQAILAERNSCGSSDGPSPWVEIGTPWIAAGDFYKGYGSTRVRRQRPIEDPSCRRYSGSALTSRLCGSRPRSYGLPRKTEHRYFLLELQARDSWRLVAKKSCGNRGDLWGSNGKGRLPKPKHRRF